MKIGIQLGVHGHQGRTTHPAPGWANMRAQVQAAEEAGFDVLVIEDALVSGGLDTHGYWDAGSIAGAVAAVSTVIRIEHAMLNPPLRHPATIAKLASTLDEISGGRYAVGIGAGNTPDDYAAFGIAADRRYSRAAETIEIVHGLLRNGAIAFHGAHFHVEAEHRPSGPTAAGPPLVVGASGPKMIRLAARFADKWNTWSPDPQTVDAFRPMVDELERACDEIGRDPRSVERSIDVAVDPHALLGEPAGGLSPFLVSGSPEEIANGLLQFGDIGIDEVRCMIWPDRPAESRPELIAAMAGIVHQVHHG